MDLTTKENILSEIENKCRESLQPRDRAKYYFILDSIPYTMNGKIDYRLLTEEVNNQINSINVDEESKESFHIIPELTSTKVKVRQRKNIKTKRK